MRKWLWLMICLAWMAFAIQGVARVQAQNTAAGPASSGGTAAPELDIMLVLDNSGSMIKNDPRFLTREVVTNFMAGFGEASRLGMVIFDQEVDLAQPLVQVSSLVARANFLTSLEKVSYRGQLSDTPAAVERAIYELKTSGRASAVKVVILLTDGIVDTGDVNQDLEKAKWLKEDLARECRRDGIRIFGIAFTDKADFSLIQTLAINTSGEYFRAYAAEDIQGVFEQIDRLLKASRAGSGLSQGAATLGEPAPPPAIDGQPQPQPALGPAESRPSLLMVLLTVGILVLLAIIALLLFLNRRGQAAGRLLPRGRSAPSMPRAELIDVQNITGKQTFKLKQTLMRIGRDASNEIAIDHDTVSSLHATIEYINGFFFVEDHRSKNKTLLNGEAIAPYSAVRLKSGDVITINIYKFIFILPDLIPSGETVIDLGSEGETRLRATHENLSAEAGPDRAGEMPLAMLIDAKNITGRKTILLKKPVFKVGRGVHNDLAIDQHSVSGSHATIQYKEGYFFLEDQRSKNKTRLNGEEIPPHTLIKLKSGDEVVFDIYKFIFLLEHQTPSGDTDENW